ncbi:MAG: hypothetical protein ACHQ4G_04110 [Opitutales bacterium]
MKFCLCFFLALVVPALAAPQSETLPVHNLRQLVERQNALLASAAKAGPGFDKADYKMQLEQVCAGYDSLLRENPNFAAGYASYGYLLSKVGMDKEAAEALLKANQLDPDIPMVKNQLGNYLAEQGKPLEAVSYYLAAIKLAPTEPLYHYQLGTLLYEARDDFIKSGDWTRASVDHAMHEAFRQAAELAPDEFAYAYRYAESFADVENPDWEGALKAWGALEEKARTPVERQVMRLQAANVFLKLGKPDQARVLLNTVTEPELAKQKEKLVALLPADSGK